MKVDELINTGLSYLTCTALADILLRLIGYDKPAIALAVAAVVGTDVAAWFYRRRRQGQASIEFRIRVGLLLAILCLAESTALQIALHWMSRPIATAGVAVAGTFLFPVVMFEQFRSRISPGKRSAK